MTGPIRKIDSSPFTPPGRWLARAIVPRVPSGVTPNQLTALSFWMYLLAGVAFYLASSGRGWFLVAGLAVFLHWLLDELDGELARARQLSSELGFFLDLYLDTIGAVAICFGLALSGYVPMLVPLALLVVFLLAVFLSMLHIVLRRQFPLGRIGPSESQAFLIVLALISYFESGPVLTMGGVTLTWFGLALAVVLPICVVQLLVYSVLFYRQLDPRGGSP